MINWVDDPGDTSTWWWITSYLLHCISDVQVVDTEQPGLDITVNSRSIVTHGQSTEYTSREFHRPMENRHVTWKNLKKHVSNSKSNSASITWWSYSFVTDALVISLTITRNCRFTLHIFHRPPWQTIPWQTHHKSFSFTRRKFLHNFSYFSYKLELEEME